MLTATKEHEEGITTAHRAKLAYVYIRQSTAGQVRQHQESTQLQYRLVSRATSLGWPRDRVEVIDEDLGKSGASSDVRYGFQRLIAEIGLGKAGLVLSLDASRLARNNRDWHQLLELCSLFGVLIADGERLYDPRAYHDRLLLGLSGIMSEAELHQIQVRLHQGERQKAARGELRVPLPAGLVYRLGGGITLNPDEEVQARLRLVFGKFQELQSAKAVMRALLRAGLPLPSLVRRWLNASRALARAPLWHAPRGTCHGSTVLLPNGRGGAMAKTASVKQWTTRQRGALRRQRRRNACANREAMADNNPGRLTKRPS